MSIDIAPDNCLGFSGLYCSPTTSGYIFKYIINNNGYSLENLTYTDNELSDTWSQVPNFNVDLNGSQLLKIDLGNSLMFYQRISSTGQFVELLPRSNEMGEFKHIFIIKVPLQAGQEINGTFQELPLKPIDGSFIQRINIRLKQIDNFDEILKILNSSGQINSLRFAPGSWLGFGGLYYHRSNSKILNLEYIIDEVAYNAPNLERKEQEINFYELNVVPPFNINVTGSEILVIDLGNTFMFYQQLDDEFIELLPRRNQPSLEATIYILKIPLLDEREINGRFQELPLKPIDSFFINRIHELRVNTFDELLGVLNRQPETVLSSSGIYDTFRKFESFTFRNSRVLVGEFYDPSKFKFKSKSRVFKNAGIFLRKIHDISRPNSITRNKECQHLFRKERRNSTVLSIQHSIRVNRT